MNKKIGKAFSLLIIALMLASVLAFASPAKADPTTVEIVPNFQEFGDPIDHDEDVIGTHFTVDIVINDVSDLYGLDIQIGWDTNWIRYVSHTKKIPVETYPDGVLHSPTIPVKDDVNETGGLEEQGAAPGTLYWVSEASMLPAAPFDGSGTVATFEFVIVNQPLEPEPDVTTWIFFTSTTLSDSAGVPIDHTTVDGQIIIYYKAFEYPPEPLLKVMPESVSGIPECTNFDISIWLMDEYYGDLNPLWDPAGFDIMLNFDPALIEGVSVTIDPDGWFASFWPGGIFPVKQEIDNVAGTVWIVFLGLPDAGGVHTPPSGKGRLVEITFHSIFEDESLPLESCVLGLAPTTIAGFPHPERPQWPWENRESSVPLPHKVEDGLYTAKYSPAVGIDIFTQYPDGFNGKEGPNPSDMFWPQKEVILYAYVMYNHWPEQNKDVAFQVMSPDGTIWGIFYGRTNETGYAMVSFRLPWPCDDPEYWFGEWTVIATVDIACTVYNDTLTFKYDYHVRIWKTTLDKDNYDHGETITITIEYGTYSMQTFDVVFTVTATDDTGVPFGFAYTWETVGGAEYCTYADGTVILTIYIPKFARPYSGTIYVGVLHDLPSNGGDALYPTREPETIVHFVINPA